MEGSIPACAGEPLIESSKPENIRVYPRVCGGTHSGRMGGLARPGLSPRVRGNPFWPHGWIGTTGSIPACAGEPHLPCSPGSHATVYPRVCGGTLSDTTPPILLRGLSPRVRGNLRGALEFV